MENLRKLFKTKNEKHFETKYCTQPKRLWNVIEGVDGLDGLQGFATLCLLPSEKLNVIDKTF